jgi:hypothetical protein
VTVPIAAILNRKGGEVHTIQPSASLADAQRSGGLTITGDKALVERFVRLFPMPGP